MAALLARFPVGDEAARDGREATGPARRVLCGSLLGVPGGWLRLLRSQSPDACGVVAGDRVADVIGDRLRRVRPGAEGAQAEDLLGSGGRLPRPAAARGEGAGAGPRAGAAP